jgi:hypothetical protein
MPHNNHYAADRYSELIQEGHGDEVARAIILVTYPHLTREYLARVLAHAASKPKKPSKVWPLPKPWASEHAYAEEAAVLEEEGPEWGEIIQRGGWRVG